MIRHWFASGLVTGAFLATTTFAQVYYNGQAAPEQRVSQLRPGWSPNGIDPAMARSRYVVSPAPVHLAQVSESSGHSFLPSWFSWGYNKPERREMSNSNPTQRRNFVGQPENRGSVKPGNAADAMPPDPATIQDGELPGLGGTRMPRNNGQASNGEYSQTGSPRTASREPLTEPSDNSPASSAGSVTRNSPARHTAPHISPEELRRELTGTFPMSSTKSSATTGTARTNGHTESGDDEAMISDVPGALPATTAKENLTAPKGNSAPSQHESVSPPVETSHKAESAFGVSKHSKSAYSTSSSVHIPFSSVAPIESARGKKAFGEALGAASGADPNILASNQTPVLTADIRGPKRILVGREAVYRVRLQNESDVPAEGIVAVVRIPSGAEVMNTLATQGTVQTSTEPQAGGELEWHITRLEHRAGETLEIHLVPRESHPLELNVSWTLAPVGSRAVVEVQEAKLKLEIAGPSEVLFDKPQVFKLTISNPGTGPAENVKIDLLPPNGGKEAASSHPLGNLAAGASQTLEVELTPREAGKMLVKAAAAADGGLTSEASKEVFCRKPELEVDWRGPAKQYAGTTATYYVRVRNPGTAPADDVTVRATLPNGAEFTSGNEGQSYDATRREVAWRVGTLGPGDDKYMELKCVLKTPGANTMKLSAADAAGELTVGKSAETNVIAIADLKLDIADPRGPVAIKTPAVYEIHVRNRGANAAKDVNVLALFSDGIEPEQAEGAMYSISDGRVSFRTIEDLPAGREVVLRIRAHATQPGTHVFRAEVLCRDLEIKLAAEETTRFYAEDVTPNGTSSQEDAASASNAFGKTVK